MIKRRIKFNLNFLKFLKFKKINKMIFKKKRKIDSRENDNVILNKTNIRKIKANTLILLFVLFQFNRR